VIVIISVKSKYALTALLYMLLNKNNDKFSVKEIAKKENISARYLEQIFSTLKKGGILNSLKGSKGGYELAKDAKDISLEEIINLLEKDLYYKINDTDINSIESTINEYIWKGYNKTLKDYFKNITLENLYFQHIEKQNIMYYI
jgi:Rrf2 family protein